MLVKLGCVVVVLGLVAAACGDSGDDTFGRNPTESPDPQVTDPEGGRSPTESPDPEVTDPEGGRNPTESPDPPDVVAPSETVRVEGVDLAPRFASSGCHLFEFEGAYSIGIEYAVDDRGTTKHGGAFEHSVDPSIGQGQQQRADLPSLVEGSFYTLTEDELEAGEHTVVITVDSLNEVAEDVETNNTMEIRVAGPSSYVPGDRLPCQPVDLPQFPDPMQLEEPDGPDAFFVVDDSQPVCSADLSVPDLPQIEIQLETHLENLAIGPDSGADRPTLPIVVVSDLGTIEMIETIPVISGWPIQQQSPTARYTITGFDPFGANHVVGVIVDPDGQIVESDESNNFAWFEIEVPFEDDLRGVLECEQIRG